MSEGSGNFRQQSLDSYILSSRDGKVAKPMLNMRPSTSTKQVNPHHRHDYSHFQRVSQKQRVINFTKDPYLLTHPLYQTSLQSYQRYATPMDLSQVIRSITLQKCRPRTYLQTENMISQSIGNQSILVPSSRTVVGLNNPQTITAVSFDADGILMAVGTNKGMIRIYDMDELQYLLNTPSKSTSTISKSSLPPILTINCRKNITHILWRSKHYPDHIFVSFSFSSHIYFYDLSIIPEDYMTSTTSGNILPPKMILEPNGIGKQSGHHCMLIWSKPVQSNEEQSSYLLAGSINGYIRCWKLGDMHMKIHNKCHWNVQIPITIPTSSNSIPTSTGLGGGGSMDHEIIYIHLLSTIHLLAITCDGHISIWDLYHTKSTTFGVHSNQEPTLLYTAYLPQVWIKKVVPLTQAIPNKQTTMTASMIPKVITAQRYPWIVDEKTTLEYTFYVLLHSHEYLILDLYTLQMMKYDSMGKRTLTTALSHISSSSASSMMMTSGNSHDGLLSGRDINAPIVVTYEQLTGQTTSSSLPASSSSSTTMLLPSSRAAESTTTSDICIIPWLPCSSKGLSTSIQSSLPAILIVQPMEKGISKIELHHMNSVCTCTNLYTSPSTSSIIHTELCSSYYRNTFNGIIETSLLRTTLQTIPRTMTTTAAGSVTPYEIHANWYTFDPTYIYLDEAQPGDTEIYLSSNSMLHSLLQYSLVGNDQSIVLSSCFNRTNSIRFQYDTARVIDRDAPMQTLVRWYTLQYEDYEIASFRNNVLILSNPYEGPPVTKGFPKVYLQSNLQPTGWSSTNAYCYHLLDRTQLGRKVDDFTSSSSKCSSSSSRLLNHFAMNSVSKYPLLSTVHIGKSTDKKPSSGKHKPQRLPSPQCASMLIEDLSNVFATTASTITHPMEEFLSSLISSSSLQQVYTHPSLSYLFSTYVDTPDVLIVSGLYGTAEMDDEYDSEDYLDVMKMKRYQRIQEQIEKSFLTTSVEEQHKQEVMWKQLLLYGERLPENWYQKRKEERDGPRKTLLPMVPDCEGIEWLPLIDFSTATETIVVEAVKGVEDAGKSGIEVVDEEESQVNRTDTLVDVLESKIETIDNNDDGDDDVELTVLEEEENDSNRLKIEEICDTSRLCEKEDFDDTIDEQENSIMDRSLSPILITSRMSTTKPSQQRIEFDDDLQGLMADIKHNSAPIIISTTTITPQQDTKKVVSHAKPTSSNDSLPKKQGTGIAPLVQSSNECLKSSEEMEKAVVAVGQVKKRKITSEGSGHNKESKMKNDIAVTVGATAAAATTSVVTASSSNASLKKVVDIFAANKSKSSSQTTSTVSSKSTSTAVNSKITSFFQTKKE